MRFRNLSLGWKHYFRGSFNREGFYLNLYGTAGLGLLSGRIENSYNRQIDTALYTIPQRSIAGIEGFKRLTVDVGIGVETELAVGIYAYADIRTWLPASEFPSPYLYNNDIPQIGVFCLGLRVLFD